MVVLTQLWSSLPTPVDLPPDDAASPDVTPTIPTPRRTRVTSRLRAEVINRYQRGLSSREVAKALGMAKSAVLNILREGGVEVRAWGVRYR